MPFAAITYKVKTGHEEEIAEIFSERNFTRADSPELHGADGEEAGRLLGTGLFIQDDTMVRVIHYEGDIRAVGRKMAGQKGVHQAEERLAPYLAEPRDTGTPEGFAAHFRSSLMTCVQSRFIEDRPARIAALRYRVRPGNEEAIARVFEDVRAEARPTLRNDKGQETGVIIGVSLFIKGDSMVRVVLYDGELEDVAEYMAKRGGRPDLERKLAPYMAEERHVETREQFLEQFRQSTMRTVSALSVETFAGRS
ncbi:SchA/CurD-like domain-containing protein [Nocardiopsis alba]|uniref:SchA/CurD-like domain-containing protein n=1 Tax=Nocardiopsis alba TaxID=53437 RepID=UPI0033A5EE1B